MPSGQRFFKVGTSLGPLLPKLAVILALLSGGPSQLSGQIQRTLGIHVGQAKSRQIWTGPFSTETVDGLSLGANVDVPTPASFLSIRAGIGYVRKGSRIWDEVLDPDGQASANVRSHYLSVPLHGKFSLKIGPGSVYILVGPTLEQLMGTSCTQDFCGVLSNERPTVINAAAGCGVSLDMGNRFRGEFEIVGTEGLTDAYEAAVSGVHYRTLEFLVRAAFPF